MWRDRQTPALRDHSCSERMGLWTEMLDIAGPIRVKQQQIVGRQHCPGAVKGAW